MKLEEYFENNEGTGVLATADSMGNVNAAVYARPHFMADDEIAFIMTDRLTHHNLQSNSKAVYLFKESGDAYKGKRLYCTKVREEKDSELIVKLRRRKYPPLEKGDKGATRYLVYFLIDRVLPLIGDND
jgi:hypothetical protein